MFKQIDKLLGTQKDHGDTNHLKPKHARFNRPLTSRPKKKAWEEDDLDFSEDAQVYKPADDPLPSDPLQFDKPLLKVPLSRPQDTGDIQDEDEGGTSGDEGSGSGGTDTSRDPFRERSHLVQAGLAESEKQFGDIDWGRRETDPPDPQDNDLDHTHAHANEAGFGAGFGQDSNVQSHPLLQTQALDGMDARARRVPSAADIQEAINDPKLQLSPELKLAKENIQRYAQAASAKPTPTGAA